MDGCIWSTQASKILFECVRPAPRSPHNEVPASQQRARTFKDSKGRAEGARVPKDKMATVALERALRQGLRKGRCRKPNQVSELRVLYTIELYASTYTGTCRPLRVLNWSDFNLIEAPGRGPPTKSQEYTFMELMVSSLVHLTKQSDHLPAGKHAAARKACEKRGNGAE